MKVDLKVDPLKKEDDEDEEPLMEKVEEKPDQATIHMGFLSIQQL